MGNNRTQPAAEEGLKYNRARVTNTTQGERQIQKGDDKEEDTNNQLMMILSQWLNYDEYDEYDDDKDDHE